MFAFFLTPFTLLVFYILIFLFFELDF